MRPCLQKAKENKWVFFLIVVLGYNGLTYVRRGWLIFLIRDHTHTHTNHTSLGSGRSLKPLKSPTEDEACGFVLIMEEFYLLVARPCVTLVKVYVSSATFQKLRRPSVLFVETLAVVWQSVLIQLQGWLSGLRALAAQA